MKLLSQKHISAYQLFVGDEITKEVEIFSTVASVSSTYAGDNAAIKTLIRFALRGLR